MNYQERVSTRAEVRALYERVCKDPSISRYRGYTATHSYGWNAAAGDFFKREGEVWFENPAYDPECIPSWQWNGEELMDEKLEQSELCIEKLSHEKSELCILIDKLNERIAAYQVQLQSVTAERDEALQALAALREALAAIRRLTQI